ncbi:DUF4269 domain-containing protein [Cellvibrio sp. PSBB023]|uniref:DUF4269 domain-containing protein n=1 Tax=Cellvibrio sp. PSBB023 TaxID=1945512 RepID=UPI00099012B0|nr:DUF4269 domain-containing protein [Cellvibrio sp. PSBB023]AQT61496.1 hypothetical protein B0D95_16315 [Cellvibrio sp. PSBB023]
MNSKITRAENAIKDTQILHKLKSYSPEVVSTIFVNLDTSESDIDIVCNYVDQNVFTDDLNLTISAYDSYHLKVYEDRVVGRFSFQNFIFEIYATNTPVKEQMAYRHYQVMKRVVAAGGNDFSEKVRKLKEAGLKTEPAICQLLQIPGDPYSSILSVETWTDLKVDEYIESIHNKCHGKKSTHSSKN